MSIQADMEPAVIARIIADTASLDLQDKFIRGQREHGGDFAVKPTVSNIRMEAIDQVNYSHMLIVHQAQVLMMLDQLIKDIPGLNEEVLTIRLRAVKQAVKDL